MAVTLVGPASGAQSPPAGKSGFRRPLPVPANTQAPQVPAPVPMAPPSASTTPLTTPPSPSGRVRLIGPASQNPTATPIAVPPAPPVPSSGVTLVGPAPQPKRTGMFAIGTSAPAPPPKPETISLGEGIPEIEVGDIPAIMQDGDNATRLMIRMAQFRKDPEKHGLETKESWTSYGLDSLPIYAHGSVDKTIASKDMLLNFDSNERMPDENLDNLARVIVNQELRDQENSKKGIIHTGLDMAAGIPALGAEIILTGGTAAIAKKLIKEGAQKTAGYLFSTAAKNAMTAATAKLSKYAAAKAAAKVGGMATSAAIMTQLNAFKLAEQTSDRILPSVVGGRLVKGESLGEAYKNASTMGTIDNLTEMLGGGIIGSVLKKAGGTKAAGQAVEMLAKMPGAKVASAIKDTTARWLAGKAGLQVPEALKVLANKAKFQSFFDEMMEERYGEGMKAISDQVLGTNIGDENMGVTGNLGLAAYKKLKGEHGAAADHLIAAFGQLAVETIGISTAKGSMRAAGFAYKAGGLDYDHSPVYAELWAKANPKAADQLLKRDPKTLSRTFFASLGLPATIGIDKREEFARWVEKDGQVLTQDDTDIDPIDQVDDADQDAADTQAPPDADRTRYKDTIVTDKDGKSYVEYMNDEGELIRTPLPEATLDETTVTPPAAPPVSAPATATRDELDPSDEEFAAAKEAWLARINERIETKKAVGDNKAVLTLMENRDNAKRGGRDDAIKKSFRADKIDSRVKELMQSGLPVDGEHSEIKAAFDAALSEQTEEEDIDQLRRIGHVADVLEILSEPITLEQVNNKLDALARSNGLPNANPVVIAAARRQRWRIENPSYKATTATNATPAPPVAAPAPAAPTKQATPTKKKRLFKMGGVELDLNDLDLTAPVDPDPAGTAKMQQAPPAGTKGKEKSFNTFKDIKDAIAQGMVEEGDSGTTLKEGVKWRVAKGANGTLYAHSVKDEPPAAEKKEGSGFKKKDKQGEIKKFVRAVLEEAGIPPEEIDAMTPEDAEALATSIENDYLASNSASSGQGPEGGKLSPSTIKKLDSEPTVTRYRSMMLIDGKLYPPMSTSLDGALRAPEPIGEWMQSEERPDLIAKSGSNAGKFPLRNMTGATWVVYAPYFHSSANPLNAQFEAAWRKPLVTVEIEIPAKDDYQAKESPRAVGPHPWGRGRIVDLSRYAKIKRIVPDSEVARLIADSIPEGTKVRDNVVTPSLRKELEKAGVEIEVTGIVPDSAAAGPAESFASEGEPAAEGKPKKERAKSWKPGATHKEKRKHLRSMSENAIDEEVDAIGPQSGGEVREIYKAMNYIDHHLETLCRMGENAEGGYEEGFAAVSKLIGENMAKMWALLNSAFSAQNAVPKHTVAGLDLAIRFDTFYHKNQRNPTEEEATAMFWETSEATRSGGPAQTTVHLTKAVRVMMAGYANNAVRAWYTDLWNVSSSVVKHAVGKVPWFGLSSQGNPKGVVLDTYMARLLTAKLIGHKYNPGMQVAVKNDKGEITGYKTLSRAQQLKEAQKKWISHDNNYIAYSARVRKVARTLSKQAQDKWDADKAAGKAVGERPRDMPAGVAQERIWAATYAIIGLKNAGRSDDEALDTIEHKDVRAAWDLMSLILENDDVKAVLKRHGVEESYLKSLATEAKAITEKYRPTGLSGFAGAGVSSRFRNFARLIRPTGPTEGAEVAKLHGRQSIDVVLSASTPHIEGLKALTDAARSGNDKEAIETLNGIARDSLEHLFGGIDGVDVSYDSNFGVYMGEGEPSLGVSVTFNEREKGAVLAALARFADNFDQQEVHVRKDTKDPAGKKDYGDGSYSTPVFHAKLSKPLTIEQIKDAMELSGLSGLTVNKNYLETYYVGDVANTAKLAEWKQRVKAVLQSLSGNVGTVEEGVARLWVYGDTDGSIKYSSIQGVVHPAPTREIKSAARVAKRHMRRKVKGTEQASEITPEQDALQTGIGDHYGAMPDNDLDRAIVREAYEEAAKELKEQFLELPIKVESWMEMKDGKWQPREGRPYQTSGDMRAGIMGNNRMFFDATIPSQFGPKGVTYDKHPLLEDSGLEDVNGYPLLYNDLLRVVHDYYAHGLTKTEFGPRGEEAAWRNHMAATKSPLAKWAITMETRGQNSWVNFRSDLDRSIHPKDRPFARQKVGLLPIKYSLTGDHEIDRGMKKFIASLSKRDQEGTLPENEGGTLKSSNASTPGFKKKFSDAFRSWFGKSKVVDEEGNPLILSHATQDDIDVFKSTGWGGTVGWFGSRKVTSEFAKSRFGWWKDMGRDWDRLRHTASGKMMEGVRIMPVYLSIKNPFDARFIPNVSLTSFSKEEFNEAADKIAKELGVSRDELVDSIPKTKHYAAVNQTYSYTPHIADLLGNTVAVEAMKAKGHDGFVTREFDEDVWVPFDSTQVKSQLSNNGNYDPSKPSINEAAVPPSQQAGLPKNKVTGPDISKGPETAEGKRLFAEQAKKNTSVGTRTITEFLADGLSTMLIYTKSQLTRKNPGKHLGAFRDRKGNDVTPPLNVVFLRNVDGKVDFHELGHAMSAIFKQTNKAAYDKWIAFWSDKLKELSNQGFSSKRDDIEEGVAEMMRLYMEEPGTLDKMTIETSINGKLGTKRVLEMMNELLAGIDSGGKEASYIRDARRLFEAHRAKSFPEQAMIFDRDKHGYVKPMSGKKAVGKGRDLMTALFGKTVIVQSMLKDAMSEVLGMDQSGMGNVTNMLRLMPVVSNLFGVNEGKRRQLKEALKAARLIFKGISAKGGDIESAFNNVARVGLEKDLMLHGSKGIRVNASNIDPRIVAALLDIGIPAPGTADSDVAEYDAAGKQISGKPVVGGLVYMLDPDNPGEQLRTYGQIKEDVTEAEWPGFEKYGQLKTILARYRAVEKAQKAWDDADVKIGQRPETYVYPEHRTHGIEEVAEAVETYEKNNKQFAKSYRDVEKFMDALLSISVISNEMSIDDARRIKNAAEHYWPLGRIQRGTAGYEGGMKEHEIGYGIERDRGGSELALRSLDEVVHARVTKALTAYNMNRLMDTMKVFSREMAKLTLDMQDKVKWMRVFTPISPDMKAMPVTRDQHLKILADYLNNEEAKSMGYANKEEMERANPGSLMKPSDIDLRGPGDVVLFSETAPRMARVIARKVQGKMEYTFIADNGVLEILSSGGSLAQSFPKLAAVMGVFKAMTSPLSRVITRSLPFSVYNTLYRDPKTAMLNAEGKAAWVPLYYAHLAIKGMIHGVTDKKGWTTGAQTDAEKEALSEVWSLFGSSTAPINAFGIDGTRRSFMSMIQEGWRRDGDGRRINYSVAEVGLPQVIQSRAGALVSLILKPMDIANWATGGWWLSPKGEALTRIGAHIDGRNRGLNQEQSTMGGDNITANFNQRSENKLFQVANTQAMFLGARLAVRWQFWRNLLHPDPEVRAATYMKVMYSGALHAMILPAVVLGLKALGDDEMDKWLEEWLKEEDERTDSDKARKGSIPLRNGWQFKIPFDDGPASMFDSMAFNASLAWLAGAKSRGETVEQAAAGMYARLMSFTGPGLSQLINPFVRTAIESEINFEFYNNRRIVPDGISSIYEKKQQTTPSTPETWNQAAEWLDTYGIEASPMKIRHFVNNIGLRYIDQVASWNDKKSPQEKSNFPVLGQLFTPTPRGFSSQSVQSLSEMDRKFDSAKKSLERAAAGGDRKRAEEASRMMISLQGYKSWHNTVMRQWSLAKKLRDAGRVDEAFAMEQMMTETARRGLKQAALQEAEIERQRGG